ncbi:MAG: recombinase family protein [Clostridium sp.]|uniref:recombinase family protein n=1 Tax=Clostridium sp. TaxID=1506 RepID=UPI0025C4529E|nr:recombinase family protein [Clostridium sp.]MCE5221193.1 recombinase family protein [Clostridium sp.]
MIFGYARVSTHFQDLEKQILQLQEAGCERIFQEKITGTKLERPALQKLLDQLRPEDQITVCDLSRISRSTKDLFKLVDIIEGKGANIKSLKESWMDTTTPQSKLMFTIFSGISQFERDMISMRTKESLTVSRARGRIGGRPCKDTRKIDIALKMYESKNHSISEITEATGVSKTTLYRYIKLNKDNK